MKEYPLTELGYYSENTCRKLQRAVRNATYMRFNIAWSNHAGNCTLIIKTDYNAPEEEIKNFFLSYIVGMFAELV